MHAALTPQSTAAPTPDTPAAALAHVPHGVLEYEPELLEAALLRALQGSPEASAFHQQRDPLYEIADPEAREASFRALHTAWFAHLRLGQVIEQVLQEYPLVVQQVQGCKVLRARSARDEGAELFVAAARRWVVLRLRPELLATPECLLMFLRRELLHIVDMLDPAFGYQPALPPSEAESVPAHLLRERYRVLWNTSIDGRLVRLGLAPAACRAHRFREFAQTFPMLGDRTAEAFARFFEGAAVTHAELVQGVCAPEAMLEHRSGIAPSPLAGEGWDGGGGGRDGLREPRLASPPPLPSPVSGGGSLPIPALRSMT